MILVPRPPRDFVDRKAQAPEAQDLGCNSRLKPKCFTHEYRNAVVWVC